MKDLNKYGTALKFTAQYN